MIKTVTVTLLYTRVSQQFDKHLYLTIRLNAYNHNTCIHLPQTGFTSQKMPFLLLVKVANHK